ncbi:MAG TPA: glycosyltransferase family 4 protein [Longimicrobiaceae bacterium]|nr:glycosyltransferase family 4 protein [Longimicrobiaceae bacterium]
MRERLEPVTVLGPFRGGSGYDHHTREFVRELVRQGAPVQLRELHGWSPPLPPDRQDPFFEGLAAPVPARVDLQFAMPHQVRPTPGLPCVNYTMFECARIPPAWVRQAEQCALVVVPARASYDAWVRSGVSPERMRISPLGIRRELFDPLPEPLPLTDDGGRPVASYGTRFLNVAELSLRKNLLGLLRAWLRATRAGDDAILLLKCSVWRSGLWELFRDDLADVCREEGRGFEDAAPVLLMMGYVPDAEMPRLYRAATHYVSLSFGEGWDMPMTEAAAAGLSLVAPRHSAYLEYLDDDSAHWIPARETEVDFRGRLARADVALFDGMRWWEPDPDAAAAVLRDVIDGRAAPKRARERVLERYGWDRVSRRLVEVLAEV